MKRLLLMILTAGFTWLSPAQTPVDYVNPLMGTDSKMELSNGNTYPAVALPWGMNFWMPQTGRMGNGWAYTYNSDHIRGFKQSHQPSPWINDYGQFAIMPVVGKGMDDESRKSWFSHKSEQSHPYYYSVYLADHDITAELTPTERCAFFRFTMPGSDRSAVVIDALDRGSSIRIVPRERRVYGYTTRNSGGVPDNFKNYFIVEFDRDFDSFEINGTDEGTSEYTGDHAIAKIGFKTRRGEVIQARVVSSFISHEQAELNLASEIGVKSFDMVKKEAYDRWNEVLGRIRIEAEEKQMETFYSCLYRSVLFPRRFYEYDREGNPYHYSPYNGEVLPGYMYTDTGFWDTFRCLFPLLNLVYPSENARIQQGLLNTYLESGFLPEWASPGHRGCMVGNNSASVVADAIIKGVTDPETAAGLYKAMLKTANSVHPSVSSTGRLGYEYYNDLGYVPYNVGINESAARTLEYAYDDWCISRAARKLGMPAGDVELYESRSMNYRNLFDPETGLMRGKNADGTFQSPFNPFKWGDAFTEGNSWHYTWSVFHDPEGLARLMGGHDKFVHTLDTIFILPPIFDASYYGAVIHEIREMQIADMGNYAHGNQPIQHMIYMYNYAGQPWKAQYWVRETMDRMYRPTPDGYCGDEDNGQTSAWYVFSALGFYPVCPASDQYVIGSPLVNRAVIQLENGNRIEINAPDNTKRNRYVDRIDFNGRDYTRNWFDHFELTRGAVIHIGMSETPNYERGTSADDPPYSFSLE